MTTTTTTRSQTRLRAKPPNEALSTEWSAFDSARHLVKLSDIGKGADIDVYPDFDGSSYQTVADDTDPTYGQLTVRRATQLHAAIADRMPSISQAAFEAWSEAWPSKSASQSTSPAIRALGVPLSTTGAASDRSFDAWLLKPAAQPNPLAEQLATNIPTSTAKATLEEWLEPWHPARAYRSIYAALAEPLDVSAHDWANALGGRYSIEHAKSHNVGVLDTDIMAALLSNTFDTIKALDFLGHLQIPTKTSALGSQWQSWLDSFEPGEFGDVGALTNLVKSEYVSTDPTNFARWQSQSLDNSFATKVAHRLDELDELNLDADSILPGPKVVSAAKKVAGYMASDTLMPEIDVDDSVGSISLVWSDESNENSFSLNFPNGELVVAIGAGPEARKIRSWKCSVEDQRRILANIQSSKYVTSFLSGK